MEYVLIRLPNDSLRTLLILFSKRLLRGVLVSCGENICDLEAVLIFIISGSFASLPSFLADVPLSLRKLENLVVLSLTDRKLETFRTGLVSKGNLFKGLVKKTEFRSLLTVFLFDGVSRLRSDIVFLCFGMAFKLSIDFLSD